MRREIRYDPLPSQLKFHLLDSRFKGFSGPVGSGKSAALVNEALRLAYVNGPRLGLIAAKSYRLLADVTQRAFLELLETNKVPYTFWAGDRRLILHDCGATILFRSLEHPHRLVGTNLAWFACDELTYSLEDSWQRLEARLRDPRAKQLAGVAVWTPNGFDWVYNRFVNPTTKVNGYEAIYAKPRENKHLPADFYDRLKASYDQRFYEQEVEGKYLSIFGGQAYWCFDRAESCRAVEFDPRWPLCWAADFNINPACSVLAQIVDTTSQHDLLRGVRRREVRVLEELVLRDAATPTVLNALIDRLRSAYASVREIRVYGDASGNSRKSSSDKTDWQHVREMLARLAVPVSYHVDKSNPPVKDRVATVNAMLRSHDGERKLFVHPNKCGELIADFEQVAWSKDSNGNTLTQLSDRDPKRTHASDALGYLVYQECRPQQGGPQSRPLPGIG